MLKEKKIEITVNNATMRWYKNKGYEIPVETVQLFCKSKQGNKIKNGIEKRIRIGTKIIINTKDLPPKSNKIITFICEECGREATTTWQAYKTKKSNNCCSCQAKKGFKGGCHTYWVNKLIRNNPKAQCDISGETDKRFLILHHLESRRQSKKDRISNYVILSANYHLAFHNWNGGMSVRCIPKQYYEFKKLELNNK